ncbi:hypothetical protein [Zoogloea sp.]|uniref:hypothetical protein n=1 Tax=Zoogloea sp. TaxID=49181 RepID=UPI0035AEF617
MPCSAQASRRPTPGAARLMALALLCTPLVGWSAPPLGRLFFTPEERQQPPQAAAPAPAPVDVTPEAPPTLATQRLDGIVRRVRDGRTILFLDGLAEYRPAQIQTDGQIRFKSETGTRLLARIGASTRPAP